MLEACCRSPGFPLTVKKGFCLQGVFSCTTFCSVTMINRKNSQKKGLSSLD